MKLANRKIILFIDNCAAHGKSFDFLTKIVVHFLPACTTSLLKSMDQGIIKNLKQKYRKRLVLRMLAELETSLESMQWLRISYDELTSSVISNCFRAAGFTKSQLLICEQEISVEEILTDLQVNLNIQLRFEDYSSVDDNLLVTDIKSVEEICKDYTESKKEELST